MTFIFEVIVCDASEQYHSFTGMGFAESFIEAMQKLEEYFADDLITVRHLELVDSCGSLCFLPWNALEGIAKDEWTDGILCDKDGVPIEES